MQAEIGDFVVYRADHVFAYHLACAIDDAEQGITDVVRGADLMASTPRQIHLQKLLGLPTPAYLHLPVAVNGAGVKLSKQTLARAVNSDDPQPALTRVFQFLGFPPPLEIRGAGLNDLWTWAAQNWRRERLPRTGSITVPES